MQDFGVLPWQWFFVWLACHSPYITGTLHVVHYMWSSTGARLLMTTTLNGKLAGLFLNHDGIFYLKQKDVLGTAIYFLVWPYSLPVLFMYSGHLAIDNNVPCQQPFTREVFSFVCPSHSTGCHGLPRLPLLHERVFKSRNDHFKSIWKAGKWAIIHIMLSIKMETFFLCS